MARTQAIGVGGKGQLTSDGEDDKNMGAWKRRGRNKTMWMAGTRGLGVKGNGVWVMKN